MSTTPFCLDQIPENAIPPVCGIGGRGDRLLALLKKQRPGIRVPDSGFRTASDPFLAMDSNISIRCSTKPEASPGNWFEKEKRFTEKLTGQKCKGLVMGSAEDRLPYKYCQIRRADYFIEDDND